MNQAKFLGVTLDSKLLFTSHVANVSRTARAAMAIVYPLITRSSNISPALKVRLAIAYIRPIFTYAVD